VKKALAANAWVMDSPASRRNNVLTPQIRRRACFPPEQEIVLDRREVGIT
jgi:hypothetical protein